jgi:hypothetical protein
MKLDPDMHTVLERLARSQHGRQGVGVISSAKVAMRLFQTGYARPVRDREERNICAVTLDGFRYLEAKRAEAAK